MSNKICLVLAVIVLLCTPTSAVVAEETLQSCAAKPATDRLACYDTLAKDTASTVTTSATESKWIVQTATSPLDDSKNVFLRVSGEQGIKDRYGRPASIDLNLSCRENVTMVYVVFGNQFMTDLNGAGEITYRVDDRPAKTKSFGESNDHEALGLWNGGSAIPWIKSIFGGKRMYVEATPFNENTVSDFLPIDGLEAAIAPLRAACGW